MLTILDVLWSYREAFQGLAGECTALIRAVHSDVGFWVYGVVRTVSASHREGGKVAATEHIPALNSLWRAPGATLEARQALQAALLVASLSRERDGEAPQARSARMGLPLTP